MDPMISDPSISSCQEMQEEADRATLEALEQRMRNIVRLAFEENDAIVNEKDALQEELTNELRSISHAQENLTCIQDSIRDQLFVMLDTQTELTQVSVDTVNLISTLQELREQHQSTLQADPIVALLHEEQHLLQQLEDIGIIVHAPTDSDEYSQ